MGGASLVPHLGPRIDTITVVFSIISKDEVLCTIILILYPDLPVFSISAARWHKKQARGQDGQRKSKPDRIFGLGRLWMCFIRPGMPVYKLCKSILDANVSKFFQHLQKHRTMGGLHGQLHAPQR